MSDERERVIAARDMRRLCAVVAALAAGMTFEEALAELPDDDEDSQ